MAELIPAIIAKNFKEVKDMVSRVEGRVKWVHVDVMDGKFVPNITWNNPSDLEKYKPDVFFEAHLMISEPEKDVEKWIDAGIKRIIFHFEATSSHHEIIQICREKKTEVAIAINPETDIEVLNPFDELVNMVLFLGVSPGFGGQKFKPSVVRKIRALHARNPHLTISVDGGMNPQTAKKAVDAGASVVVAGSYIYQSGNVEKAIDEMKEAINF